MKIFISEYFKSQLKKIMKKFPHAKEDLLNVLEKINLKNEISIGKSIYKIRIKSRDMNRGKSGGFRSYLYLFLKKNLLVPLCMYAKSDQENLSDNELQYHFRKTIEELVSIN